MVEVRCAVCGSTMKLGNKSNPVSELKDGINYLVPEVVRNENVDKSAELMGALRVAGIDVSKLQTLMQTDPNIKNIFSDPDNEVLAEIGKGGFIRNPELFRRWITAQTFSLIKAPEGWTKAVRSRYNITYVFNQTLKELKLQIKLQKKGIKNDKRYSFFSFEDMKDIFWNLVYYNHNIMRDNDKCQNLKDRIINTTNREELLKVVENVRWWFRNDDTYRPRRWINSFKGAGAYYTLQNIIRTHGFVIPSCKDMNESLALVEDVYNTIMGYEPYERRWDILMSLLTTSVTKTHFELKW